MEFTFASSCRTSAAFPMQNGETIVVKDVYGNVVEKWYIGAQIQSDYKDRKTGELMKKTKVYHTIFHELD